MIQIWKKFAMFIVLDNGGGSDHYATKQKVLLGGLDSMFRRVEIVGGQFEIISGFDAGTTLRAIIPMLSQEKGRDGKTNQ